MVGMEGSENDRGMLMEGDGAEKVMKVTRMEVGGHGRWWVWKVLEIEGGGREGGGNGRWRERKVVKMKGLGG